MAGCRSCRSPVVWVEMVPSGRKVPLDPDPVADLSATGVIVRVGGHGYTMRELVPRVALKLGISETQARETVEEKYEGHLSHFATCPDAARHRRK